MCDSERCCSDGTIQVDVMEGGRTNSEAKLSDLLEVDSKFMTTGQNNKTLETEPRLYTLDPDFQIALETQTEMFLLQHLRMHVRIQHSAILMTLDMELNHHLWHYISTKHVLKCLASEMQKTMIQDI